MLNVLELTVLERSLLPLNSLRSCLRNVLEQTTFISKASWYVNKHAHECGFYSGHFQPGCAKVQVAVYQNVPPGRDVLHYRAI